MIKLPWPPTVNHYYTVVNGRKILSARGQYYKQRCGAEMLSQEVPKSRTGRYCVTIHAHPPDKRKRDLDNLLKPVLDALTEYGAIVDDSLVDDLRIQRFDQHKGGKLEVLVSNYQ